MVFQANVVRVMIASPGDVLSERKIARVVVHEWNTINAVDRKTVLVPIGWETDSVPAIGDRPQAIINKQLLKDADLLVAIFWTRLGTHTGAAASGTVEEIEEHVSASKPMMLYFSSVPVRPESVDAQQYERLQEFKDSIKNRALVETFDSPAEFEGKLRRQLALKIIERFAAGSGAETGGLAQDLARRLLTPSELSEMGLSASRLSADALTLLSEAASDPHGYVLVTLSTGGLNVQTKGKNMLSEPKNPREQARWRGVVNELVEANLLEQADARGEMFQVTDRGYKEADRRSPRV